jgi:hypothetical protein
MCTGQNGFFSEARLRVQSFADAAAFSRLLTFYIGQADTAFAEEHKDRSFILLTSAGFIATAACVALLQE